MERTYIRDTASKKGEEVLLKGWVDVRRDHGKLMFIDLRDATGIAHEDIYTGNKELYNKTEKIQPEWVVEIAGTVKERPDNMKNAHIETGSVEIEATQLIILNESHTPPFDIASD